MKKINEKIRSILLNIRLWIIGIAMVSLQSGYANTVVDVIVGSEAHTTLATAVTEAGLVTALQGEGPFTVFAPTNAAFDALPEGLLADLLADPSGMLTQILLYHVVGANALSTDLEDGDVFATLQGKSITIGIDESGVSINGVAMVIAADLTADNGVVHVIDAVLVPPTTTVVDIIVDSEAHTTLAIAVTEAGLVGALQGEGPFTVFAPTNAAFDALPEGLLADLLADPSGTLTQILLYHVVGATALSTDLEDGDVFATLQGKSITIGIDESGVSINGVAMVIAADLTADNGVVHVIDAVLVPPTTTVVDIIVDSEAHTTLAIAVTEAGLVGALQGEGPFTVFAPTNAAFDALPEGLLADLLADPSGTLTQILLYHVVGATALSTDLEDGDVFATLQGKSITIGIDESGVSINGVAMVIAADLTADNGVVHVIDAVLVPPTTTVVDIIVDSEAHTTLATAVTEAGLVGALQGEGPFTVFAPTNAAFDALPEGLLADLLADPSGMLSQILLYHVVGATALSTDLEDGDVFATLQGKSITIGIDESGVSINGVAMVIAADLTADNGVVHVIDAVLVPPTTTVVDIIVGSEAHTTLATAVTEAGLVTALQGEGPFTVFAPTNAAFDALPEGLLADLLADPSGTLTQILLYHVVGATALSTDLEDGDVITTLQGKSITIGIDESGVSINGVAMVIAADLTADNGVVHVIDAVLVPPTTTVVDIIVDSEAHTTLATAVTAAGLVTALQGEGPFTVFAPTNAAFDALPEGLLADLLADPSGMLTDILLYHVIGSVYYSVDLNNGLKINTLFNKEVEIALTGKGLFVNQAKITVTDLVADNGVVHVIDAVLVPSDETGFESVNVSTTEKIELFPNPASSEVNIGFNLANASSVTVEIINIAGQRISSTNLGVLPTGYNSVNQNLGNMQRGIYMVIVNAGGEKIISKLQIDK
jgi:uncharacterized surface protein with fasciclin (FAS1) repeats